MALSASSVLLRKRQLCLTASYKAWRTKVRQFLFLSHFERKSLRTQLHSCCAGAKRKLETMNNNGASKIVSNRLVGGCLFSDSWPLAHQSLFSRANVRKHAERVYGADCSG